MKTNSAHRIVDVATQIATVQSRQKAIRTRTLALQNEQAKLNAEFSANEMQRLSLAREMDKLTD